MWRSKGTRQAHRVNILCAACKDHDNKRCTTFQFTSPLHFEMAYAHLKPQMSTTWPREFRNRSLSIFKYFCYINSGNHIYMSMHKRYRLSRLDHVTVASTSVSPAGPALPRAQLVYHLESSYRRTWHGSPATMGEPGGQRKACANRVDWRTAMLTRTAEGRRR